MGARENACRAAWPLLMGAFSCDRRRGVPLRRQQRTGDRHAAGGQTWGAPAREAGAKASAAAAKARAKTALRMLEVLQEWPALKREGLTGFHVNQVLMRAQGGVAHVWKVALGNRICHRLPQFRACP